MSSFYLILLSVLFYVTLCSSRSLQVGNILNSQLVFVEEVQLSARPLTTRTKNVFYSGERIIKAVTAVDRDNSEAQVIITAGGVGSTFVNVRLKGKRGEGLNYQVQVYV